MIDIDEIRARPVVYLGSVDERAIHKLAEEILKNSLEEASTGHASWIEVTLNDDNSITISDNGRGIPVELHPAFPGKSALEIVLTRGGSLTVVNAYSGKLQAEVSRGRRRYRICFIRGKIEKNLEDLGPCSHRGTTLSFHPDPDIFGSDLRFKPSVLYAMIHSTASQHKDVEINWKCNVNTDDEETPVAWTFKPQNIVLKE